LYIPCANPQALEFRTPLFPHLVNKCVEKIKACKQKLSELKKYENIIKKKHASSKTINKFLKI
jgi:hypothetical protein